MSLKEKILAADDRPSRIVRVKEWDCVVVVKTMSGKRRDAWEVSIYTGDDLARRRENIRAKMLVETLFDEAGEKIFSVEDIDALGEKSAPILERLYDVAAKLNGVREGDIKELEKNS